MNSCAYRDNDCSQLGERESSLTLPPSCIGKFWGQTAREQKENPLPSPSRPTERRPTTATDCHHAPHTLSMQRAISSRRALLPKSSRGLSSVAADWAFPVPVTFGAGRAAELPAKLRERGSNRPLLVADKGLSGAPRPRASGTALLPRSAIPVPSSLPAPAGTPVVGGLFDSLAAAGLQPRLFGEVDANPTDLNIVAGAAAYREHAADGLVAVGGGSGLDAGKSIAMVAGSGRSLDELEWTRPPVEEMSCPPLVLIPTTAGARRRAVIRASHARVRITPCPLGAQGPAQRWTRQQCTPTRAAESSSASRTPAARRRSAPFPARRWLSLPPTSTSPRAGADPRDRRPAPHALPAADAHGVDRHGRGLPEMSRDEPS